MVSTGLLLFARLSIFKGFKLFSLYAMYSRELIYLVFFFFFVAVWAWLGDTSFLYILT